MIEGKFVNLRAREVSDAVRSATWSGTPDMIRLMGDRYQAPLPAMELYLEEELWGPSAYGEQLFAIETKDGRHIGNMGLSDVEQAQRRARIAIRIGEAEDRSKGYGADAMRTILRFAFQEMNLNRVELEVFEYNGRAIAAYKKCGFVEEARLRLAHFSDAAFHDALIMAVLRSEFDAADAGSETEEVMR